METNHVEPVSELRNHTSRVNILEELLVLLNDQRVQVFLKCLEPGVFFLKRDTPARERLLLKRNSGKNLT